MSIKETVKMVCSKYNTRNPYELAKFLGIEVIYQELGQVRGYYFCQKRIKLIYINSNLEDYTERFVLAHELGHAVMHPKSCTPFLQTTFWSVNKLEIEANKFASELLIPDSDLQEHWEYNVDEFARFYGVPKEIIELRFKDM